MSRRVRIRNGVIQTPFGPLEQDVVVDGERIAALVQRDAEIGDDIAEIDAAGLWVFPGLVDLHAHTRVPGYEYKEDFETASRAAAVGGYTTFVDMPNVEPPTTTVELLEEKREIAKAACLIDWGHFVAPTELDQIPLLAEAGATGFKVFQVTGGYPHDPRLAIDDPGRLYATFKAIAATGLACVVHPFAQTLFERLSDDEAAQGSARDIVLFGRMYTMDVVWRTAVAVLLELQRETGVQLHLVHTHAAGTVRLLRAAKHDGLSVTAACDPKYIHLRHQDLREQGARALPGGFITEDERRMAEIWKAIDDGTIDVLDSDHAPHTLEDLERMTADPWTGPWGAPQYDHMLSLLLTDVHEGRIRLERLVELIAATPAKIIGRYPEKGAVLPGSSADLVLIDPDRDVIPEDHRMESKPGWTPYAGWKLKGASVLTMLRGVVIARDGEVVGEPGFGRYLAGIRS
jgi:dihydroorotase (multifunctional complex type)